VSGLGRSLIALGMLMFAFVGYQLWGTGLQTARAQDSLERQFEQAMQSTSTSTSTTTIPDDSAPPSTGSTTTTLAPAPSTPDIGTPVGRLRIDRIGLDIMIVEGIGKSELQKGPGHFRETPLPGQLGNVALAGHRTTYLHPFLELDQLQPGDLVSIDTTWGSYTYRVTESLVVQPDEYSLVIPTFDNTIATLTLTTCHPAYTSKQRLAVRATLAPELSSPLVGAVPLPPPTEPPATVIDSVPDTSTVDGTTTAGTTDTVVDPTDEGPDGGDAFSSGWFDDTQAIGQSIWWGLSLIAVSIGSWFSGRAAKRLYVVFGVGLVPFLVVLYFFFENVNRLLPAGL
jgi:sortase A